VTTTIYVLPTVVTPRRDVTTYQSLVMTETSVPLILVTPKKDVSTLILLVTILMFVPMIPATQRLDVTTLLSHYLLETNVSVFTVILK